MYGLLFRSLFLQRPTRHSTRSQDCNKKTHHFVFNSLLTCSVFCFCFFNSAFQVKSIAFQWSNTGGIAFLHLIDRRERRPTYSRMRLITCSVSEERRERWTANVCTWNPRPVVYQSTRAKTKVWMSKKVILDLMLRIFTKPSSTLCSPWSFFSFSDAHFLIPAS